MTALEAADAMARALIASFREPREGDREYFVCSMCAEYWPASHLELHLPDCPVGLYLAARAKETP